MSETAWVLVPGAPVLLPGVGGRTDPGSDLREVCVTEIAAALPSGPFGIVLVFAADPDGTDRSWPEDTPYALELLRGGKAPPDSERLPLSLAVGRSLVEAAGWTGPLVLATIGAAEALRQAQGAEGAAQGAEGGAPGTVSGPPPGVRPEPMQGVPGTLVLVGDGSLLRHEKGGPGPRHAEAERFDEQVRAAVAAGDGPALAALDPGLAAELGVTGLPVWRLMARAFADRPAEASVSFAGDPFGPYALVATWRQS